MDQIKEMKISIKRINHNLFIVGKRSMNYLELITWFQELITEQELDITT